MYKTKKQERIRNWVKGTTAIVVHMALITTSIPLLVWVVMFFGLDINILSKNGLMSFLLISGLIAAAVLVPKSIDKCLVVVDDNEVLLTYNPFWNMALKMLNRTDYNEYTTGQHCIWWFENQSHRITLNKDLVFKFDYKVSVSDDEINVKGIVSVLRDITKISNSIVHGLTEAERWDNIETQMKAFVKGQIETILKPEKVDDIFDNRHNVVINLRRLIAEASTDLCNQLGVRIDNLEIEDLDYSDDASEARRVANEMKILDPVIEKLRKKGMTGKEAFSAVRVMAEVSSEIVLTVNGPEGSTVNIASFVVGSPKEKKGKKK